MSFRPIYGVLKPRNADQRLEAREHVGLTGGDLSSIAAGEHRPAIGSWNYPPWIERASRNHACAYLKPEFCNRTFVYRFLGDPGRCQLGPRS